VGPLRSLDFSCAQRAICIKQIAFSQPCEYRALDIAECVAGFSARLPCERFFEEGHLALQVPEEFVVETAALKMSAVPEGKSEAPGQLLREQRLPEVGAHQAA